jgi:hypothetical protein
MERTLIPPPLNAPSSPYITPANMTVMRGEGPTLLAVLKSPDAIYGDVMIYATSCSMLLHRNHHLHVMTHYDNWDHENRKTFAIKFEQSVICDFCKTADSKRVYLVLLTSQSLVELEAVGPPSLLDLDVKDYPNCSWSDYVWKDPTTHLIIYQLDMTLLRLTVRWHCPLVTINTPPFYPGDFFNSHVNKMSENCYLKLCKNELVVTLMGKDMYIFPLATSVDSHVFSYKINRHTHTVFDCTQNLQYILNSCNYSCDWSCFIALRWCPCLSMRTKPLTLRQLDYGGWREPMIMKEIKHAIVDGRGIINASQVNNNFF